MSTTKTPTHPDELNDLVEFDSPFCVNADGSVTTHMLNIWAPNVYLYVDADGNATGTEEIEGTGWVPVTGFSGQQGYKGPVMHPSEQLGGGMAEWVMSNPDVYCITSVECVDERDLDGERDLPPAGWMLLRNTN